MSRESVRTADEGVLVIEAGVPADLRAGQVRNLVLATLATTICLWAWTLIGSLGSRYAIDLDLSSTRRAVLVAVPVLAGSIGRIAAGGLADKYGGRLLFTILPLTTAPFVLLVAVAGNLDSYGLLLAFGLFLGVGGTVFPVGVSFASAWFDPARRGLATGVVGAGVGGTALAMFFTPRFVDWLGYTTTHVLIAIALGLTALMMWSFARDSPAWQPSTEPVLPELAAAARRPVTWQMSCLYAVLFGGVAALSTDLPTYVKDIYGRDLAAGAGAAALAAVAVLARPLGGILADRIGARLVVTVSLTGTAALSVIVALQPPIELPGRAAFVLLALFLGLGAGGVFAWVVASAPLPRVGSAAGIVSAAGGLGGFFPPLVLGATYESVFDGYGLGLALLIVVALLALLLSVRVGSAERRSA